MVAIGVVGAGVLLYVILAKWRDASKNVADTMEIVIVQQAEADAGVLHIESDRAVKTEDLNDSAPLTFWDNARFR